VPLPGGDAATLRPYRVALAHLYAAGIDWEDDLAPVQAAPDDERAIICQQIEKQINAPLTSSMGRLFDAVASLLGVLQTVTYEAQAAIWLEAQVDPTETGIYPFDIQHDLFDPAPALRAIIQDWHAGIPTAQIAARFHNSVAQAVRDLCHDARQSTGINSIVLSGGVFQNVTLLTKTVALLKDFTVYTHRLVPPNDGGLALGQAAIAAYQLREN
jgi:hydrogenase maturation protein HypF